MLGTAGLAGFVGSGRMLLSELQQPLFMLFAARLSWREYSMLAKLH